MFENRLIVVYFYYFIYVYICCDSNRQNVALMWGNEEVPGMCVRCVLGWQ